MDVEVDLARLRVFRSRSLGRGGSAAGLYRCRSAEDESFLFKQYRPEMRTGLDGSALVKNIRWRVDLPREARAALDRVTCWPRAAVLDRGSVAGVLLKQAPGEFFAKTENGAAEASGWGDKRPRDLSVLASDSEFCRKYQSTYFPVPRKLSALGHLLEALALLHRHGVVVGDMQFKNTLVSGGPGTMSSYLLDCDGMTVAGRTAFRAPMDPELWRMPDSAGFSPATDLYKVALAVVRCLAERPEWSPGPRGPRLDDLTQVLPRTDISILTMMLTPGEVERVGITTADIAPMASAWRQLVSESGSMFRRDDRFAFAPWTESELALASSPALAPPPPHLPVPTPVRRSVRRAPWEPMPNPVWAGVLDPDPVDAVPRKRGWRRFFGRGLRRSD